MTIRIAKVLRPHVLRFVETYHEGKPYGISEGDSTFIFEATNPLCTIVEAFVKGYEAHIS